MLRLITLFSLSLLLIAFSQIKKEFDLQVEIIAKEVEEKPKLSPPQNLPLKGAEPMDLSSGLLEPPKEMEFIPVAVESPKMPLLTKWELITTSKVTFLVQKRNSAQF
jgi:hypothetical protein